MPPPPVVERTAGVAQVDVVERRPRERDRRGRARPAPRARRAPPGRRRRRRARGRAACGRRASPRARPATRSSAARPAGPSPSASSTWIVSPCSSLLSASGVPRGDDPPAVDDRELRGEPVGLLEVVGREQDRHALLAREPLDLGPHLRARLGVEPRGGLVEEQHLRAGGSAPSRRRAAAACRRSRS